jgi:hypothetical protein
MMTEIGTSDTVEVARRIEALEKAQSVPAATEAGADSDKQGEEQRPEADGPSTPAPPASPEHGKPESPEKAADVHGHPETPV